MQTSKNVPKPEYDHDYSRLPEGLQGGMQLYLEKRISTGSFLTACLENDLVTAVMKADPDNLLRLREILRWMWWNLPQECWGSREIVHEWKGKR